MVLGKLITRKGNQFMRIALLTIAAFCVIAGCGCVPAVFRMKISQKGIDGDVYVSYNGETIGVDVQIRK